MEQGKLNVSKQRTVCIFADCLATFCAFFCFNVFRFYYMKLGTESSDLADFLLSTKLILEQALVPVALLFVYWLSGYYNQPFEKSRLNEFLITLYSQLFNALVIYLGALTNDQLFLRRENWMLLLILFLLLFSFTYLERLLMTHSLIRKIERMNIRPRTVLVGLSKESMKLATKLIDSQVKPNASIVALMPLENEEDSFIEDKQFENIPRISGIEELKEFCIHKKLDQIIIVPSEDKASSNNILYLLYHLFPFDISIKIKPDLLSIITPTIRLQDIMGEPFVDLAYPQISEFSKNVKRTLDVVISSLGMLVLSPLYGAIALGIKISGNGKVIYSQERVGIHRKPFRIYKFRSMIDGAEKDGVPLLSSDNDQRITGIGKWMRKYRLDELPQFWNVLKGDMSIVGPRPERAYFIDKIVIDAPWYPLVLQVRPGITSWGMVKYGYATDVDQMIERNRYDLIYLANMSLAVDFKILIHTIKTVGAGEGK